MSRSEEELEQIGRIIRLIKIHRQARSEITIYLSRDQFLKYYLKPDDWYFWEKLKQIDLLQS